MGDEDEVGVDTGAADRAGGEVETLAQRYARIGTDFQVEMTILSDASAEMQVVTGALDYCADVVAGLTRLQAHTGALGTNALAAASSARRADVAIGAGLAAVFAR